MLQLVTREEMQRIDSYNIEEIGIPGIVLMERAALSMAEEIRQRFPADSRVFVVCERGNNGGDGLAVGRILMGWGYPVAFYEIGIVPRATESYDTQRRILDRLDAVWMEGLPEEDPDIWIDGIFGVGLTRPVEGQHQKIVEEINRRTGYVIAVDTPSGIDASNGQVCGAAIRADLTITFGLNKLGLLLYPGADYAGEVLVKDIGFTPESVKAIGPRAFRFTKEDLRRLPERKAWSNKGTYGKVLLIAGSVNMAGAAILAGRGAYRAGSGLVRIFTREENRLILQTGLPDAILTTWASSHEPGEDETCGLSPETVETLYDALSWAEVIGIGSGLGQSGPARAIIEKVLESAKCPLVIDADGINLLAQMRKEDSKIRDLYDNYPYGIILTPHMGEMSRWTGRKIADLKAHAVETARESADPKHILVLKDARTLVSDGQRIYINVSGNHGMSVGGSGDVLTGLICGLAGQGADLFDAACLGVYVHGLAGDEAAREKGRRGLMASDLPDASARVMELL